MARKAPSPFRRGPRLGILRASSPPAGALVISLLMAPVSLLLRLPEFRWRGSATGSLPPPFPVGRQTGQTRTARAEPARMTSAEAPRRSRRPGHTFRLPTSQRKRRGCAQREDVGDSGALHPGSRNQTVERQRREQPAQSGPAMLASWKIDESQASPGGQSLASSRDVRRLGYGFRQVSYLASIPPNLRESPDYRENVEGKECDTWRQSGVEFVPETPC